MIIPHFLKRNFNILFSAEKGAKAVILFCADYQRIKAVSVLKGDVDIVSAYYLLHTAKRFRLRRRHKPLYRIAVTDVIDSIPRIAADKHCYGYNEHPELPLYLALGLDIGHLKGIAAVKTINGIR